MRLWPNDSRALAWKESWTKPKASETSVFGNSAASTYWKQSFWVKRESPQKNLETSVTGNSAASTYWKQSSCMKRESPFPNMKSQTKKPLKPACLAIARLRPTESRALAWKERHLFPNMITKKLRDQRVWRQCGFDQMKEELLHEERESPLPKHDEPNRKPSETSVSGNSTALSYWKQSFWVKREAPLPDMMSQATKPATSVFGHDAASTKWKQSSCVKRELSQTKNPLKPACLAIVRLRPTESRAFGWKESHLKKTLKPVWLVIVRLLPTESRALAWKESHLFPTWRAKPKSLWNQRVWQ